MTLAAVIRILLAVMLVVSSFAKFQSRKQFEDTLRELWAMPWFIKGGSWAIPAFEVLTSGLLLWDGAQALAHVGLMLLLVGFAWANWVVLSRKKTDVACNCFGALMPDTFGRNSVMRVLLLMVLSVYLMAADGGQGLYPAPPVDLVSATFMSVGVLFIYSLLTTLVTNSRRGTR